MFRLRLACALSLVVVGWITGAMQADDPLQPIPIGQKIEASAPAGAAANPAACGCNPQGNACDPSGLYAEIGFYYIEPRWKSNPAFFSEAITPGTGLRTIRQQDFSFDSRLAPHAAIGMIMDDGLGARIRWSQFEDTGANESIAVGPAAIATTATPLSLGLIAPTGSSLVTEAGVRTQLWDLELTQDFHACHWTLVAFGGLRFGRVSQDYDAATFGAGGVLTGSLHSGHSFQGVGPTIGIEAHRPLGCGGFGLYGTTRGSLLFGHTQETADSVTTAGEVGRAFDAKASREDVLPIWEVEIGAEYAASLGDASLFVQAGFVGQVWFSAGNSSNTDGVSSVLLTGVPFGVTGRNTDLGFIGINLTAGIRY